MADNLWAIAKHVEAMRGLDRWGVGDITRAFTGYAALPAKGESLASDRAWMAVLGLENEGVLDRGIILKRYRALHERADGDADRIRELDDAVKRGMQWARSGELAAAE